MATKTNDTKTITTVELTVRTDMKSAVKFEASPELVATGIPVDRTTGCD